MKFEHATGFKQESDNIALYNARFYEGRYIIGQIAAKQSKTGLAGYIVSFPIPEVVMGINSFMLGAQSVNPDFKVKIVWVNTWFDPGKEADAAKALFDQGADIIVQHTDSTARAADRRGARPARLRPGVRHDHVRTEGAVHRDRRRLGAVLHAPRSGADRRHLEAHQRLGRASRKARCSWRPTRICPTTSPRPPRRSSRRSPPASSILSPGRSRTRPARRCSPTAQVMDDGTLLGMNWYVEGHRRPAPAVEKRRPHPPALRAPSALQEKGLPPPLPPLLNFAHLPCEKIDERP